jgi:cytochrome c-type biogenesis protein CcmH/NrfG
MIKGSCLALILLIGSSMILTASSQEQVNQTVYVHEGDLNGTLLSGVQVAGQDAAGNSFSGMTNSYGVAVVSGQPGAWLFVFIKDGYETLDLNYNVTETGEGAVYLVRSDQPSEQIAPPQEQVSKTVYAHEGDLNGTLLSGVQVTGQDAAGNLFEKMTNSSGVAVISGQPGAWKLVFTKDGYKTLDLSYNVTETGEGAVYLVRSDQPTEQIASSQTNSQLEAISESNSNETKTASPELWLEKGNYLYEQGRYDEAVVFYDQSLLLNPQLGAAWFNKGNALYMQGNYDEALQAFDRAIVINPQNANSWICRGLTLKKLDRTLEANAAFARAKELEYAG